jgi:hypothetical protein
MDKTLIFCTENKCPEPLFTAVLNDLKSKAKCQIVSVTHKPIDLGINICIGEHKRSWTQLYRQLLIGCKAAKTKYIGIVEHDCFYTEEYLDYIPPSDDKFYYNENVWLVCYDKEKHPNKMGMYSRFWTERLALSQMVCNRALYLDAIDKRLDQIDKDRHFPKKVAQFNEPGLSRQSMKLIDRANNGSSAYLKKLLPDFIELEKYETFATEIPNLDVRHGGNFTGPKHGKEKTFDVPHWGKFEDFLKLRLI